MKMKKIVTLAAFVALAISLNAQSLDVSSAYQYMNKKPPLLKKAKECIDRATVHRGGKGVKAMQITEKTGPLVAVTNVTDDHDLMIINRSGITIRMKVADLRVLGRATQGVKLIDLRGKDYIASITKVPTAGEEDEADAALEGAEAENIAIESNNEPATDTNNQTEE